MQERLVHLHFHGQRGLHGLQCTAEGGLLGFVYGEGRVVTTAQVEIFDELLGVLSLLLTLLHGPLFEPRKCYVCAVEVGTHGQVGMRSVQLHLDLLVHQGLGCLCKVLPEFHEVRGSAAMVLLPLRLVHMHRYVLLALSLDVGLDGHVRLGVGDACQAVASSYLVIIQESLGGLVHRAFQDLPCTTGAGTSAARVRELEALLLCLVKNEDVLRALKGLGAVRCVKGDLVVHRNAATVTTTANAPLTTVHGSYGQ
mmetsp:Transcript_76692/g.185599  ORF Transcript_76692/g.185599 Transcript_76692/m.185599 type:complete len:254 (+) Transcript_76692:338-1099(+)